MKLSILTEQQIANSIINGQFLGSLKFENICNALLKKLPEYNKLTTNQISLQKDAPRDRPDASIYIREDKKFIFFEYTTREKRYAIGYVEEICKRKYISDIKNNLQELVIVFSQLMGEDDKTRCQSVVENLLSCSCRIIGNQDLVSFFMDYGPDLVESCLGIKLRPKRFVPVEEAINQLHDKYEAFPSLDDFLQHNIYLHEQIVDTVSNRILNLFGPNLLIGRWGSGKTVCALSVGLKVQQEYDFLSYYVDLSDHAERKEIQVLSELREGALIPFKHEKILFIIDNGHIFPQVTHQLAMWSIRQNANVLFVSRPIPREASEEKLFFPRLFERMFYENSIVGDKHLYDVDMSDENNSVVQKPKSFTIQVEAHTMEWMIKKRMSGSQQNADLSEYDIRIICEKSGYNLTLLALILKKWQPDSNVSIGFALSQIHGLLAERYSLDLFPELYVLAALSYVDCAGDMNVIFDTPERVALFLDHFLKPGSKQFGLIRKRGARIFGIHSAEARIICEMALSTSVPFLRYIFSESPKTFAEVLRSILIHYAIKKPSNPYELLRYLWWASYEAGEFEGHREREIIIEIIAEILSRSEFTTFLHDTIFPNRLSMLGLGTIARLCKFAATPKQQAIELFPIEILRQGVNNYMRFLEENYSWVPRFTWKDYFAWKHLRNIDAQLGSNFLSIYNYSMFFSYGRLSIRNLSDVFFMASQTDWLKPKVMSDIQLLFGESENFDKRFGRLGEAGMTFFMRNCYLLDNQVIQIVASYLPAKNMAQIVKGLPRFRINLLSAVSHFMGPDYFKSFFAEFDEELIYKQSYSESIIFMNCAFSDRLFHRFIDEDFFAKVASSSLHELQLFFRNLCLHGFKNRHRSWVRNKLKDPRFHSLVIHKVFNEQISLNDLSFYITNLHVLCPQVVQSFTNELKKIDLRNNIMSASLAEIAFFLFNIWSLSDVDPMNFIDAYDINTIINKKLRKASVIDLLAIGGIANLFNLNVRVTMSPSELLVRFSKYLERMQLTLSENEIEEWLEVRVLKSALAIYGLQFYGCSSSDLFSLSLFDKLFITRILENVKKDLTENGRTAMSMAIGRFPVDTDRKIFLINEVLLWLNN